MKQPLAFDTIWYNARISPADCEQSLLLSFGLMMTDIIQYGIHASVASEIVTRNPVVTLYSPGWSTPWRKLPMPDSGKICREYVRVKQAALDSETKSQEIC